MRTTKWCEIKVGRRSEDITSIRKEKESLAWLEQQKSAHSSGHTMTHTNAQSKIRKRGQNNKNASTTAVKRYKQKTFLSFSIRAHENNDGSGGGGGLHNFMLHWKWKQSLLLYDNNNKTVHHFSVLKNTTILSTTSYLASLAAAAAAALIQKSKALMFFFHSFFPKEP